MMDDLQSRQSQRYLTAPKGTVHRHNPGAGGCASDTIASLLLLPLRTRSVTVPRDMMSCCHPQLELTTTAQMDVMD